MRPELVSRLPRVGTTIFTVMSQLATELGAVNLGQGFPDFEPPGRLRELVAHHLAARHNQYSPMAGLPKLREQVAAEFGRLYGVPVDAGTEVTVTAGGTEALFCAIQAVVHPGDEVIVFDPAYDSYEPAVELAGGRVVHVPLSPPDFGIDFDRLAAALTARTSLVIVNTPHNPSGRVLDRSELDSLAQVLEGSRAFLLTDEVYQHLVYDGRRHVTALEVPALRERTLAVFSFGKTYHATGWKVGHCVAAPPLSAEFRKVHQYVTFAVSSPVQHALADFMEESPGFVATLAATLQERRDRFLALLEGSRFRWVPAASTYFQLVDYAAVSDATDLAFCDDLVRRHGVAAIPLSPFCAEPPAARLVRFCFAKDDATLERGAARLRAIS